MDDGDFGLLCTLILEFGATSWKFNDKGSGIEDAEIMENLTAPVANYWQMYIGGTAVISLNLQKAACCFEIIRQPKDLDSMDFYAYLDKTS